MLNIRFIYISYRLNDVDRLPFSDPNDERLDFILKMATIFKQMDNSVRGARSNALHQTLVGIVDLIETLLSLGHQYALPGKFSSDRTEGEFGIYRQSSGRNFLISAEQVFSGLQLQRIKLFSKLDIHVEGENIVNDCCKNELKDSEEDLNLVEQCFEEASNLNSTEKASLYYICGYVAQTLDEAFKTLRTT